jgi:hypothetical protein
VGGYDAVSYRMVRRDTSISFGAPVALGRLEELFVSVNGRVCDVSAVADLAFSYGPPVVRLAPHPACSAHHLSMTQPADGCCNGATTGENTVCWLPLVDTATLAVNPV